MKDVIYTILKVIGLGAVFYNLFKNPTQTDTNPLPEELPPSAAERDETETTPKTEEPPTAAAERDETETTPKTEELPTPKPPTKKTKSEESDDSTKTRCPREPDKYGVICREIGGEWNILLKLYLPSAQQAEFEKTFRQNDNDLQFDHNKECKLQDYSSAITCEDGEINPEINGKKKLYIFRFAKDWHGEGKRVGRISRRGYYLVIASQTQKRINVSPPFKPERCLDKNFLAHYFPAADGKDGFDGDNNSFISGGFSLKGETIYDNSENGDLFTRPPEIVSDGKPPTWIRIAEIGGGNWGNVVSSDKTVEDALEGRSGGFYIRINDVRREIDSMYFRFSSLLRKILINDIEYSEETVLIPSAAGHNAAQIRFVGIDGENLHLRLKSENHYISMREDGAVNIEPHPDGDFSQWTIEENNGTQVDIGIALPRIWWRIDKNGEWRDKPMTMTHEEFRNLNKNMEISIPANIRYLMVGIKGTPGMKCPARLNRDKVNRAMVKIRWIELIDLVRGDPVKAELQAAHDGMGLSLIHLLADPQPLKMDDMGPAGKKREKKQSRTATLKIKYPNDPKVKTSHGWRRGRGFSIKEIYQAGFSARGIRIRGWMVDVRRKTVHNDNIDILTGKGGDNANPKRN